MYNYIYIYIYIYIACLFNNAIGRTKGLLLSWTSTKWGSSTEFI